MKVIISLLICLSVGPPDKDASSTCSLLTITTTTQNLNCIKNKTHETNFHNDHRSNGVYQISTLVSYGACREIRHVMKVGEEVGHLIGAPGGPHG